MRTGGGSIPINATLVLDPGEIEETFIRASGPGGQNVNKVSSAVQLRFDLRNSRSLPEAVAIRLAKLAGKRLTREGVIVITAQRFRTQEENRADARARLVDMIRLAAVRPVPRRPTKPTLASKRRRLEAKGQRSGLKAQRRVPPAAD